LELFGNNAVIIITVREPVSYFTSVYQQTIHEGNIVEPRDFFVRGDAYDKVPSQLTSWRMDYFDVDSFDLEKLHNIYKERFKNVYMVSLGHIREFNFLKGPLSLSCEEVAMLQKSFLDAPPSNRSYSILAMHFTFLRERLLNVLGAKSIGSNDRKAIDLFYLLKHGNKGNKAKDSHQLSFSALPVAEKVKQLPFRVIRRIFYLSWRSFMQVNLDKSKWLQYKKYTLPSDVYLNESLIQKNRNYIEYLTETS